MKNAANDSEIGELRARVERLEKERAEMRAAVAAAWARVVTLVQTQDQKIGKLRVNQQTIIIELNKHRKDARSLSDTGKLMMQQRARWLGRVRDLMCQHYNKEELRAVCFDFGLDHEAINGSGTVTEMAQSILAYFDRRQTVDLLVARLLELRPSVAWPLSAVEVDTAEDAAALFDEILKG